MLDLLYTEKKFNETNFGILIIIYLKKMFQQRILVNQNMRRYVHVHESSYNSQFCSVLLRSTLCISHDRRYLGSKE